MFGQVLRRSVLAAGVFVAALAPASASAAVQLVKVGSFNAPVYIAGPPGDTHRLMIVEQAGRIQEMVDQTKQTTAFLDISARVHASGEQGLLSMAFAPDYATSGKFYVYYSGKDGCVGSGCNEHVSEFTRSPTNPNVADPTERPLLTISHPSNDNHNGGQLQFGPDGKLYISTGDGGDQDDTHHNAQFADNSHLLGKMLRIDPANPGASVPGNIPGTPIYAYGLRNPWRFSFDRLTGDMVIADVGQSSKEEIDFAHPGQNAGANYGWPCWEGTELNTDSASDGPVQNYPECSPMQGTHVPPVHDYGHSGGAFSGAGIIGGYVVRDAGLPELYGRYLYGDLSTSSSKGLRSISLPAANDDAGVPLNISNLSSFGEDTAGCVYAASVGSGSVWRIAEDTNATPGPCGATTAPGPAADTTPPNLSLGRRRRQHVLRTHSIRVAAVANEIVTFTGTATVKVPGKAATLRFRRATRRASAGRRVTLVLKLNKKTLRRLRRAMRHHHTRIARVTVTARDAAGNARTKRVTIRLVH
jgi:glucose/arabinose dehydrogenase